MKKILSVILILAFVISMIGCTKVDFDLSKFETHDAITSLEMIESNYEMNEGKTIKIRGILSKIETEKTKNYLVILKEESHNIHNLPLPYRRL